MLCRPATPPTGRTAQSAAGLPLTPSVALRNLYEQLLAYRHLVDRGMQPSTYAFFTGTIRPPARHQHLPMADPVFDAIADYASKVIARAGLLTSRCGSAEQAQQLSHEQAGRALYAIEHAVAVDLGRVTPHVTIKDRDVAARAVLAVAAYWCDRVELVGIGTSQAHPLLGMAPSDSIGAALYHHALKALMAKQISATFDLERKELQPDS